MHIHIALLLLGLESGSPAMPVDSESVYVADYSGHVISIVTFGDELLCLPGINWPDYQNMMWMIDPTILPEVGTKVTLRLLAKPEEDQGY